MAASVLIACGLNDQKLSPNIYIGEECGADGSFLISAILGQRLRVQNSGIILVSLHHSFQHYNYVGMRLGYNLGGAKDKSVRIIEPFETSLSNDFLQKKWTENVDESLSYLCNEIDNYFEDFLREKTFVTIVIDDISVLLNLGVSEIGILNFVTMLRCKIKDTTNSACLIVKLNTCNLFERLSNCLSTYADLHITVEKLKSGNFKEVDGKIVIRKPIDIVKSEKTVLYKVNEKNIKIFNLGEVGVKI